jgi:hypothetical protein
MKDERGRMKARMQGWHKEGFAWVYLRNLPAIISIAIPQSHPAWDRQGSFYQGSHDRSTFWTGLR